MNLEEIIKKENEIVKHEQFFQNTHIVFTDDNGEDVTIEMLHCDDTECVEESLEISRKNLEYHQQLVDCIKELEVFRKQAKNAKEWHNDEEHCVRMNEIKSYNQALEELGNALCDEVDKGGVFIYKNQILYYVKKLKK